MEIKNGVDIISVERVEKSLKSQRFIDTVFAKSEQEFLFVDDNKIQSAAANFAGKEAFSKAIGTGISGFKLSEVAILRDEKGAPYIELSGDAKKVAEKLGFESFSISISHDMGMAIAFIVAICNKN